MYLVCFRTIEGVGWKEALLPYEPACIYHHILVVRWGGIALSITFWCGQLQIILKRSKNSQLSSRWWFQICSIFTPIWGRFPILTNIFQMGGNHQPVFFMTKIFQMGWNHQPVFFCSWFLSSIKVWPQGLSFEERERATQGVPITNFTEAWPRSLLVESNQEMSPVFVPWRSIPCHQLWFLAVAAIVIWEMDAARSKQ